MGQRDRRQGGLTSTRLAAAAVVLALVGVLAGAAAAADRPAGERAANPASAAEDLASAAEDLTRAGSTSATERSRAAAKDVIPGRYIVVYEDDVQRGVNRATRKREQRLGFRSARRYRHAVSGFSARLSPGQVGALERDPDIAYVSEDRRVRVAGSVPLEPNETVPTGIRRIGAAAGGMVRGASEVGVAVIDTGVKLDHPDLAVEDGTDCVDPGTPANDGDGHGTHVAGTVAARNQDSGVVGVTPGTTIHAVRVLDDDGIGEWSEVICGIDWVTANADELDIRVANMSLGGLMDDPVQDCDTSGDPLHEAICASTEAGIVYVAAAGNDDWEFDHATIPDVPAAYPEVLTVTAMADSDGEPGGTGSDVNCAGVTAADDTAAPFSNFALTAGGREHTIAAPGCWILSTYAGGGDYAFASGTSMAAPHVAGVVALCIDEAGVDGECAGLAPDQVIGHVRAEAQAFNAASHPGSGSGLGYGFLGDPLNPTGTEYYGFLTVAPGVEAEEPDNGSGDPDNGSDDPDPDDPGDDSGASNGGDGGSGDDPAGPEAPADDSSDDGAVSPASLPAGLEIRRARVRGRAGARRLIVRGSLDPAAAGARVVVRFRARGRGLRLRPMVAPNGGFALNRRLRGAHRRARGGRLVVRFPGTETLRPARERLRAARRPVRLRFNRNAPRVRGARMVVGGRVHRRARGRVRIMIAFNRPDGSPAEITALASVNRRGRFHRGIGVPPAARTDGTRVSLTHRGRGRLHGQRIGRTIGG